jgi:hypothetical protein
MVQARDQAKVDGPAVPERLPPQTAATSAPERILSLQRSAGNAAVTRMLSRPVLARAEFPAGKEQDSGYWGKRGEGIPSKDLGQKISDDLLSDPKYAAGAPDILTGYWIVHIVEAVDEIRKRGKLGELQKVSGGSGRVTLVVEMIADPAKFDPKAALGKLNDREYGDLTGLQRDGTPIPGAPGKTQISEVEEMRIPLALERFADDRQAVAVAKRPAAPAGAPALDTQSARTAPEMDALVAFDTPRLKRLEELTEKRQGPRWFHKEQRVTDAILAAFQLRAVGNAMGDFDRGAGAAGDVHSESSRGKPGNWCGMFSAHELVRAGMQDKHNNALDSTQKVYAFFNYLDWHPTVALLKMKDDAGNPVPVKDYHLTHRHEPRKWIPTANLAADGLDIRSGDVLTMAVPGVEEVENPKTGEKEKKPHRESEFGDHIVMVHSYDRTTGKVTTIGGNDGSYYVRGPKDPEPAANADREAAEAATGKKLGGSGGSHVAVGQKDLKHQQPGKMGEVTVKVHVSGIGRPSIVDFEVHEYLKPELPKPPPPKP